MLATESTADRSVPPSAVVDKCATLTLRVAAVLEPTVEVAVRVALPVVRLIARFAPPNVMGGTPVGSLIGVVGELSLTVSVLPLTVPVTVAPTVSLSLDRNARAAVETA